MLDLHSHILPNIDDGARTLSEALEMARIAVADGTTCLACTPHITPGIYENRADNISTAVASLTRALADAEIPLKLVVGADVHVSPHLTERLRSGVVPTLNNSRYFLLEPPHHVVPPRIGHLVDEVLERGFIPIITHPERLTWISSHYDVIERLNDQGCLIQLTAGSIVGSFGKTASMLSERLLKEGRVDIIASDAHNVSSRSPRLSPAVRKVAEMLGADAAERMVVDRPWAILEDRPVVPAGQEARNDRSQASGGKKAKEGSGSISWFRRWFGS